MTAYYPPEWESLASRMIGRWCPSFTGATGLQLPDTMGRNHGVLTNFANNGNDAYVASPDTLALDLDGLNDYVEFANSAIGNRDQLTVSFWAKPRTTTSRIELNQATNSTARGGFGIAEDGNAYIVPASVNDYGLCNWATLGVSQFIHFIGVFDGIRSGNAQRARIFLNGTERTLSFIGNIPAVTGTFSEPMRLGTRVGLTSFSDGQVDDIIILHTATTANEARFIYQQGRGGGLLHEPPKRRSFFVPTLPLPVRRRASRFLAFPG